MNRILAGTALFMVMLAAGGAYAGGAGKAWEVNMGAYKGITLLNLMGETGGTPGPETGLAFGQFVRQISDNLAAYSAALPSGDPNKELADESTAALGGFDGYFNTHTAMKDVPVRKLLETYLVEGSLGAEYKDLVALLTSIQTNTILHLPFLYVTEGKRTSAAYDLARCTFFQDLLGKNTYEYFFATPIDDELVNADVIKLAHDAVEIWLFGRLNRDYAFRDDPALSARKATVREIMEETCPWMFGKTGTAVKAGVNYLCCHRTNKVCVNTAALTCTTAVGGKCSLVSQWCPY